MQGKLKTALNQSMRQPIKLPNLKGAGRENPSEGMSKFVRKGAAKKKEVSKIMCGLCGSMHVPGDPHITKKASQFNVKTGLIAGANRGYN